MNIRACSKNVKIKMTKMSKKANYDDRFGYSYLCVPIKGV